MSDLAIGSLVIVLVYTAWEVTVSRWIKQRLKRRGRRRRLSDLMKRKIIGVPPKTMLRCITRHQESWCVWTGIDDMQKPYERWTGTYVQLLDNGTALRVIVQPDGGEETMQIM